MLFENFDAQGFSWRNEKEKMHKAMQTNHLITQVCKKLRKGKDLRQIMDELEEDDEALITEIINTAEEFAPDYDEEKVIEAMHTYETEFDFLKG